MTMMYYHDGFIDHSLFGFLFMLVFWGCVVAGIFWLVRNMKHGGVHSSCCHGTHQNAALDILKERYARGEINKEEFDAKKKDLSE